MAQACTVIQKLVKTKGSQKHESICAESVLRTDWILKMPTHVRLVAYWTWVLGVLKMNSHQAYASRAVLMQNELNKWRPERLKYFFGDKPHSLNNDKEAEVQSLWWFKILTKSTRYGSDQIQFKAWWRSVQDHESVLTSWDELEWTHMEGKFQVYVIIDRWVTKICKLSHFRSLAQVQYICIRERNLAHNIFPSWHFAASSMPEFDEKYFMTFEVGSSSVLSIFLIILSQPTGELKQQIGCPFSMVLKVMRAVDMKNDVRDQKWNSCACELNICLLHSTKAWDWIRCRIVQENSCIGFKPYGNDLKWKDWGRHERNVDRLCVEAGGRHEWKLSRTTQNCTRTHTKMNVYGAV